MYTCGITPYDATHLGHAADVPHLRRPAAPAAATSATTRECVRNITDVDDSHARQGPRARRPLPRPGRRRRRPASTTTWRRSTCSPCWSEPRATSAIPDIRGFIGMVLDRGPRLPGRRRACTSTCRRSPRFGSGQPLRPRRRCSSCAAERGGNVDDPNKRDPLDFVLWQPSARRRAVVGHAVGPGPARAGTSSARRWRCASSAPRSTCTAAAPT